MNEFSFTFNIFYLHFAGATNTKDKNKITYGVCYKLAITGVLEYFAPIASYCIIVSKQILTNSGMDSLVLFYI